MVVLQAGNVMLKTAIASVFTRSSISFRFGSLIYLDKKLFSVIVTCSLTF